MRLRHLLLLFGIASSVAVNASGWRLGAVCNNVSMAGEASQLLRGRHLRVLDMVWAPFASRDPTTASGWRGFDIDLLTRVAELLGFTFDIFEFAPENGETWTEALIRCTAKSDLMLLYWARLPERIGHVVVLPGHIDMSATLIGRLQEETELHAVERAFRFARPFTLDLWAALFALIIFAGAVDYVLERRSDDEASLLWNCYEAFAGVLYGGFEYPKSRGSAVYQIILAFIVLVVISAYTANLAAFMTTQSGSVLSTPAVLKALAADPPPRVCAVEYWPLQSQLDAQHPQLSYELLPSNGAAAAALAGAPGVAPTCDAAVVSRITYDIWRASREPPSGAPNCNLRTVETIFSTTAGWATNRQSPCVEYAVDWAVTQLELSGEVARLRNSWLTPVACTAGATERLAEGGASDESTGGGRRLSSRSHGDAGGAAGAGAEAGGASEEVPRMNFSDFAGLFVFFVVASAAVLVANEIAIRNERALERVEGSITKRARSAGELIVAEAARLRPGLSRRHAAKGSKTSLKDAAHKICLEKRASSSLIDRVKHQAELERKRRDRLFDLKGVNRDNEAAMVHRLLQQMTVLRQEAVEAREQIKANAAQAARSELGRALAADPPAADQCHNKSTAPTRQVRKENTERQAARQLQAEPRGSCKHTCSAALQAELSSHLSELSLGAGGSPSRRNGRSAPHGEEPLAASPAPIPAAEETPTSGDVLADDVIRYVTSTYDREVAAAPAPLPATD